MEFKMDPNNNIIKYDIEKILMESNENSRKRNPKCRLCQNHMPNPPSTKNHKKVCDYANCPCEKCFDVKLGRKFMASSAQKYRKESKYDLFLGNFLIFYRSYKSFQIFFENFFYPKVK